MTRTIRRTLALPALLAMALSVGCGQQGPLYLPGDPSEMRSIDAEIPALEEDDTDEEENAQPASPQTPD